MTKFLLSSIAFAALLMGRAQAQEATPKPPAKGTCVVKSLVSLTISSKRAPLWRARRP